MHWKGWSTRSTSQNFQFGIAHIGTLHKELHECQNRPKVVWLHEPTIPVTLPGWGPVKRSGCMAPIITWHDMPAACMTRSSLLLHPELLFFVFAIFYIAITFRLQQKHFEKPVVGLSSKAIEIFTRVCRCETQLLFPYYSTQLFFPSWRS